MLKVFSTVLPIVKKGVIPRVTDHSSRAKTLHKFSEKMIAAMALVIMASSCGGDDSSSPTGPVSPPTQNPPPETAAQFVARTMAGTGSTDLVDAGEKVIFSGCLRKNRTEDPRTLGSAAFLTNLTQSEYRLIDFAYVMDTSGIRSGESAETDVGFTVLPKSELVALNSGEELMITHRYDVAPNDRGITSLTIPSGGFAIKPDQRLSIGSVSAIFPLNGSGAQVIDDARLADGSLFRVCYSATVVRADKVAGQAVQSYRSAYRDRSYVADPARTTAPFTAFRNTSDHPVKVYGIGSFLSNLSSTEPSLHAVDVLVDNKLIKQMPLPDHVPGKNSASMELVDPVDITLAPGATLTVKGRITPKRAIVFDYAAFIFADQGLTSIDEKLDILPVDLNGDGYNDIVDLDSTGSVWVSLRVGQGLQNTQQEWARALKTAETFTQLPRIAPADPIVLQARNKAGLCLNMTAMPSVASFKLDYCTNTGSASLATDSWGDFNGDGFVDRLRVDAGAKAYLVALGSAQGLGQGQVWAGGYGAVEKMFISDSDGDGLSDVLTEWTDSTGLQCRIFYGAGDHFRTASCP